MRFIADLKDEQLLPIAYDMIDDISNFMQTTNVLEIRKRLPKDGISVNEQGRQNVKDMLKVICKDYPSETATILRKLWVLDEGETEEDKPNFVVSISKLLQAKWLIDFFISAVNATV